MPVWLARTRLPRRCQSNHSAPQTSSSICTHQAVSCDMRGGDCTRMFKEKWAYTVKANGAQQQGRIVLVQKNFG